MKYFFSVLALLTALGSRPALAAEDLGQRVAFQVKENEPEFTMAFSPGPTVVLFGSGVFRSTDLSASADFTKVSWRLYDSASDKFLTAWIPEYDGAPKNWPGDYGLNLIIEDHAVIKTAVNKMKSLKIVFSINEITPKATHYLDLGSYCRSHPRNFVHVDKMRTGC